MIKRPRKTRSQNKLPYNLQEQNKNGVYYDKNKTKSKLIENNLPIKRPFKPNKIEQITQSKNEFQIHFLIMSHDGGKSYADRRYKYEKLIHINKYIDKNNRIQYSFIKERLDNCKLYNKFVTKQDLDNLIKRKGIYKDIEDNIPDITLQTKKIVFCNKDLQEQFQKTQNILNDQKTQLTISIQKLEQKNQVKQKELIETNISKIQEYEKQKDQIDFEFKKFKREKIKVLLKQLDNIEKLDDLKKLLMFQLKNPDQEQYFVLLRHQKKIQDLKLIQEFTQNIQKIYDIQKKYLRYSKNKHLEDIINYIDYYELYRDIKANFKQQEKIYTVNTLMNSYDSICNKNQKKGCKQIIKFIQEMLAYMDLKDVQRIENNEALTHRNVGHVNYSKLYDQTSMKDNAIKRSKEQKAKKQFVFTCLQDSSSTSQESEFSQQAPRSSENSQQKLAIYFHHIDDKVIDSIKSQNIFF